MLLVLPRPEKALLEFITRSGPEIAVASTKAFFRAINHSGNDCYLLRKTKRAVFNFWERNCFWRWHNLPDLARKIFKKF
jgi:hypothetical protein